MGRKRIELRSVSPEREAAFLRRYAELRREHRTQSETEAEIRSDGGLVRALEAFYQKWPDRDARRRAIDRRLEELREPTPASAQASRYAKALEILRSRARPGEKEYSVGDLRRFAARLRREGAEGLAGDVDAILIDPLIEAGAVPRTVVRTRLGESWGEE